MAVSRTRVVGPVGLPDGTPAPDGALIRFTLPAWDKDGDAIIVPGRVETVVEGGAIDVDLWRTGAGERTLTYDVTAIYHNAFTDRRMEVSLGRISLIDAGPFALAELLSLPAPVPDVPDALALARASAAAARSSAALSQAWAESEDPPDPEDPASKSAKTSAGEAAASVASIPNVMAPHIAKAQAWAESGTAPDPDEPTSKSAKTLAGEAAASVASIPTVMAPHIEQAQAWAESPTAPDADLPGSKSAKTLAGEAAASAGVADGHRVAAAGSAGQAQTIAANLGDLYALTELERFANLGALAELAGAAGGVPYFTDIDTLALIASTPAGRALLELIGAADTLPYYTDTGAVARASFTPAARAALGLAGVASEKNIPMLTGPATAGLASVGTTGLSVLGAGTQVQARNAMGLSSGTTAAQALGIASVAPMPGITNTTLFRVFMQDGEQWAIFGGSGTTLGTGAGDTPWTYGFTFVNTPWIVVSNGDAAVTGGGGILISAFAVDGSGFSVRARISSSGAPFTTAYRFNFIAIGRIS